MRLKLTKRPRLQATKRPKATTTAMERAAAGTLEEQSNRKRLSAEGRARKYEAENKTLKAQLEASRDGRNAELDIANPAYRDLDLESAIHLLQGDLAVAERRIREIPFRAPTVKKAVEEKAAEMELRSEMAACL